MCGRSACMLHNSCGSGFDMNGLLYSNQKLEGGMNVFELTFGLKEASE